MVTAARTQSRKLYYNQAVEEFRQKRFDPAYLIYGEEILLTDNLLRLIKENFLEKPEPEINLFTRYASEEGADAVLSLGAGMGLFSQKKLIILKEANALSSNELKRLRQFLLSPNPDILLVLQANIPNLYQSRLKKIENDLTTIQVFPLREAELLRFVKEEFARSGKQITDAAAQLLIFMVGNQMADLISQINHLVEYYSEQERIDAAEVEAVASTYVTQDVFQYVGYLAHKQFDKAIFVLHHLLESGVAAQQIIYHIQRHFTILWRIQGYWRSGIRQKETIARELNLFARYVPEYLAQSRKWSWNNLKKIMQFIKNADKQLKDNQISSKIVLDILSYQIINS